MLLRREFWTTKKKPIELFSCTAREKKVIWQPTADNDTEQDANDKVPDSHEDHNADDSDVFCPGCSKTNYFTNIAREPEYHYLLVRCLVSHKASLTRSMPSTNIKAPTTTTAMFI